MAVRRPGWFLCREVTKSSLRVSGAREARLWRPGVLLQEASELSSLKPQLEELGVPLVAVVKENIGAEIQDFRPHFAGDVYIDEKVSSDSQRTVAPLWVGLTGASVCRNTFTARCRGRWGAWASFVWGCGRISYGPGGLVTRATWTARASSWGGCLSSEQETR